ncbi:SpoIIE family protein phosphatase [Halomonas campisalis]|uniref:SpoIIE family protein phosphatase n=1 Tax=Billgrantia campisalis TaxID=74661 RepID=A0ABS9P876_9GAMM|nr:biofilm regulation protein phosphatase SiaA [Halomonas campisalis]MCG6657412.1 SpoIIE family protein phosphatase [Halomonas campisalis]MDR5863243.1 biofilm regulation protein phosphatase SiaA [Halomonas campisalis]
MAKRLGLRGKSTLTLLLACLIALIPALLIGWQAVEEVRRHFASAYAEQYTLLQMQRIVAPVSRELALSRRFAGSVVTREWLRDPADPQRRERFMTEAEGYRQQFGSNAYFVIDDATGDYYFGDAPPNGDLAPSYRLSPDTPGDSWYFDTMSSTSTYNINVNVDQTLEQAMIWINVKVRDNGETLGLAGGGIELGQFLNRFIRDSAPGLTPMIIDSRGALQAHPDQTRIALSSGSSPLEAENGQRLQSLVPPEQREGLRSAMHDAMRRPGHIIALDVELEGEPRLLSVGYIPELQWFLVTALDLQAAPVLDSRWFWPLVAGLGLVLALLMAVFAYATDRLILSPLGRLQLSAKAIAAGDYATRLPTGRSDEIGALSRAFSDMADQVADHTQRLEEKVRQRTRDLEQANEEMRRARRQVDASLEYASIIQRAILPSRQLDHHLADRHAVVWRPRDQVGGDFYVFRATEQGYLMGVIDCAGHGVPGSLMTMLARAIVDHAILLVGPHDPAAILAEMDRQNRATLHRDTLPRSIATNMDAALVWVDPRRDHLTFAGAKLALYASDGERLEVYPGGKRALGHKRPEPFLNQTLPLRRGWTYTLCTDGFLDQAGGEHGFGFGNRRFEAMIVHHARVELAAQAAAFEAELDDYRGEHPQRDDITLLCFRFDPPPTTERQTGAPAAS